MAERAVITINGPGHDGTRVLLQEGITSFGRLPSNDVVLLDDLVSRNHARITFFEGRATLQDLGSHNGSYVNGQRIDAAQLLEPGDLCRIGSFQILYRWTAIADASIEEGSTRTSSSLLAQIEAARSQTDDHPQALQVLLRATEALATASEVDDYLRRMLELALDQTGAERGAYVEPKSAGLKLIHVCGPDGNATDAQVVPAVVEWAVSKRFPLRVDDLAHDLRFEGPSQSILCVPVAYEDDVLGAFHLTRALPPFAPEGLDTLIAVAHLTGVGIQASRARRTTAKTRLAADTLARSFSTGVAEAIAAGGSPELQSRRVTLLTITLRDWPSGVGLQQIRSRIAPLLEAFCRAVTRASGDWHIGPGPSLCAIFDDDAGPARAVGVVDVLRGLLLPSTPPGLRAAITRGSVLAGVAEAGTYRLAIVAGPATDENEQLLARMPAGHVRLTEAAARVYPGPLRAVDGGFEPT